jgi:AGCS family alanine or glycine:cation symporter
VEDAVLLLEPSSVAQRGQVPFSGWLEIPASDPGDLSLAALTSAGGDPMAGRLALRGKALQNGSPLTAWAFQRGLEPVAGRYGYLLVTLAVFLFGLSTAISWSYYGDRSVLYLFGPRWVIPYRVFFCIMHFLGAIYSLELVWSFGDVALGLMTIPNLLSILLLTGTVKGWLRRYQATGSSSAGGDDV